MKRVSRGFTLVELMVGIFLILILMGIAWNAIGPQVRRNDVLNSLRYTRAAITSGRAKAIEYTQPVRMTLSADNRILLERDPTRDGNWDDAIIIMGEVVSGNNIGIEIPFDKVTVTTAAALSASLPHWTGLAALGNVSEFPDNWIIFYPDGTVLAGDPLVPTSGTWFFQDDRDSFYGAVHLTAMGEVKLAYAQSEAQGTAEGGPFNGWFWTD